MQKAQLTRSLVLLVLSPVDESVPFVLSVVTAVVEDGNGSSIAFMVIINRTINWPIQRDHNVLISDRDPSEFLHEPEH